MWLLAARLLAAEEEAVPLLGIDQRSWQSDQGLPTATVRAVLRTRDGFLWLGTPRGLFRFDGVVFEPLDRSSIPALESESVWTLHEDRKGTLWAGTMGSGVIRIRDGAARVYGQRDGLTNGFVRCLLEDSAGTLWAGTRGGGLFRLEGDRFVRWSGSDALASPRVWALAETPARELFVGTNGGGIAVLSGGRLSRIGPEEGLSNPNVVALHAGRDGAVWAGTDGGGLFRIAGGRAVPVRLAAGSEREAVLALAEAGNGGMWVGTLGRGVQLVNGGRPAVRGRAEGLPSGAVLALHGDRNGTLWVGTDGGGLTALRRGLFSNLTPRQGFGAGIAWSVAGGPDGSIWIGTNEGGAARLKGTSVTRLTRADGLSSDSIRSVAVDEKGVVWLGTRGNGIDRLDGGRVQHVSTGGGASGDFVWALLPAPSGVLWAGTSDGLLRIDRSSRRAFTSCDGRRVPVIRSLLLRHDGSLFVGTIGEGLLRLADDRLEHVVPELAADTVFGLAEVEDGTLWVATNRGLARVKAGGVARLQGAQGLPGESIYAVLDDGRGSFWLPTARGLHRVERTALEAVADGKAASVKLATFGVADGMESEECSGGSFPSAWRGPDGLLYFPTARGVAVYDSSRPPAPSLPPRVHIEAVRAGGTRHDPSGPLTLGPGQRDVEIDYTAPELLSPARLRFRYRLAGHSDRWTDAGNRRVALYPDLAPGRYRFEVSLAGDPSGVASVELVVTPRLLERRAVRHAAALAALLAAVLLVAARFRAQAARASELDRLVKERTAALAAANQRLLVLSTEDGLTGLANRRHLDETLELEWRRAWRTGVPLSVALFDVDHFKPFNDTHGHAAGDDCLRRIAEVLARAARRPGDLAARYGGEEFALVLSGSSQAEAEEIARAAAAEVAALGIPHGASVTPAVTVSGGVAGRVPSAGDSPALLLEAADAALYEAKHAGRNRVLPAQASAG